MTSSQTKNTRCAQKAGIWDPYPEGKSVKIQRIQKYQQQMMVNNKEICSKCEGKHGKDEDEMEDIKNLYELKYKNVKDNINKKRKLRICS